jgi:hypothetical protein
LAISYMNIGDLHKMELYNNRVEKN